MRDPQAAARCSILGLGSAITNREKESDQLAPTVLGGGVFVHQKPRLIRGFIPPTNNLSDLSTCAYRCDCSFPAILIP